MMADPQPERRRGRPSLQPGEPSVPVTFKLPSKQYDQLEKEARRERVNIREMIRRKLRDEDE